MVRRAVAGVLVATAMAGAAAQTPATGRVLRVGPDRALTMPSAAASIARPGDRILIDAGTYRDCAVWRTPDLTIEGAGGLAHIRDVACEGKAIWVFYSAPVTVRQVRFSGARVARRNGAGIRWEGGGPLTVEDSVFDDNQMGILSHNRRASRLVVVRSRFEGNGNCETFCGHALYAGLIAALTVRDSVFTGHYFGHHIKSRALASEVSGTRIGDGAAGTSSYAIDLPNSGSALIRGNVIAKGPGSDNPYCAICIGEEIVAPAPGAGPAAAPAPTGVANPSDGIVIEGNRFDNATGSADTAFVWNRGPHAVTLRDNALTGPGVAYVAGPRPELDKTPD